MFICEDYHAEQNMSVSKTCDPFSSLYKASPAVSVPFQSHFVTAGGSLCTLTLVVIHLRWQKLLSRLFFLFAFVLLRSQTHILSVIHLLKEEKEE